MSGVLPSDRFALCPDDFSDGLIPLTEPERNDRERRMAARGIRSAKFVAVKSLDRLSVQAIPSRKKMMVLDWPAALSASIGRCKAADYR